MPGFCEDDSETSDLERGSLHETSVGDNVPASLATPDKILFAEPRGTFDPRMKAIKHKIVRTSQGLKERAHSRPLRIEITPFPKELLCLIALKFEGFAYILAR
jgi:hypothetical protein